MAVFLVIAHLDQPERREDETFRTKLLARGMTEFITGPSGSVYRMPLHTYLFTSDLDKKAVRDLVGGIVDGMGENASASIYVQLKNGAAWVLDLVSE